MSRLFSFLFSLMSFLLRKQMFVNDCCLGVNFKNAFYLASRRNLTNNFVFLVFMLVISLVLLANKFGWAIDSFCARVKIEILQEATFERQAFDAHMRINNGLSNISIENVNVQVKIFDVDGNLVRVTTDPHDTDALFFIRVSSMEGISNVDGNGAVAPSSSADIHWLIIPAPGAAGDNPRGTLYYVGATLSYTLGGEKHVTEVSPDYIYVKPMPDLVLDYFIPTDVYGDDPFTPEIEPPVPFSLGVRVCNHGYGVAKNLKIESAQPKIVENEQNILINFIITGSEVNGKPATESLLVNFGDIGSQQCGTARWIMECTLSGKFVEFTASFTHADELGGEVTSLIQAVNTHFLIHNVLVDLPGRDNIKDFLAKNGDILKVYESEGVDTIVTDQSDLSQLVQLAGQSYKLTTPVTEGFMYVKLPNPYGGAKIIQNVIRSDGKVLDPANFWVSQERTRDHGWRYFVNIFDFNTPGEYQVVFGDPEAGPPRPVLQYIPDYEVKVGEILSFIITASNTDGTIPILGTDNLPEGAEFTDRGDGAGIFEWRTDENDVGRYEVTFWASNGEMRDSKTITITVSSGETPVDADDDGLPDEWELYYFGSLEQDANGDFDGDGLTNLEEYQRGTDPTTSNAPSIPQIIAPEDGAEIDTFVPTFTVRNSVDPDGDNVTYECEIYTDEQLNNLVASGSQMADQEAETTSWSLEEELSENTWYYWRVRATDGHGYSQWAYGRFFVNTENEAPGEFHILEPVHGATVDTLTPLIKVSNALDPDGDAVFYRFEIYIDEELTLQVANATVAEGEEGYTSWQVPEGTLAEDTSYYVRVVAFDEEGLETPSETVLFTVNTANQAPSAPQIVSPETGSEVGSADITLEIQPAEDPDGDPLTYFFELDVSESFDTEAKISSGEIDNTSWEVTDLSKNTWYYWRVRASDGEAMSPWTVGSFFVNMENDPPAQPQVVNPGEGAEVEDPTPVLEVTEVTDPDHDAVHYRFEVYADAAMENLILESETEEPRLEISQELQDRSRYYWRACAVDEHGLAGEWTPLSSFLVNLGVQMLDRLVLEVPEGPVQAGLAFRIKVKALDQDGQLYEAFEGPVSLSVSSGTITPETLTGFINGLWDGQVIIEDTTGEVVITAEGEGLSAEATVEVTCAAPAAPSLVWPEDGSTVNPGDMSFTWGAVEGAESYEIEVAADSGFNEILYSREGITTSFIDVSSAELSLAGGVTYYWRVRAVNECGEGAWSEVYAFSVPEVEPQITITSPEDGATLTAGEVITITWDYQGDVGKTVKIRYNTGGRRWSTIATGVSVTDGSYSWTVPNKATTRLRIKIESEQDRTIYDIGGFYTIEMPE